jgi:hypothetical protein
MRALFPQISNEISNGRTDLRTAGFLQGMNSLYGQTGLVWKSRAVISDAPRYHSSRISLDPKLGHISSAPFATLLVDVPAAHSWTVYQLLGDWFAWVAIVLLAMIQMVRLHSRAQG